MRPSPLTPEALEQARAVMELGHDPTISDIKAAYRSLAKRYHPDRCPDEEAAWCHEKMVEINAAYRLLLACHHVSSEDIKAEEKQEYEQWWWKHFGDGPV